MHFKFKGRKTLRLLHRDLGYFIVGMVIVYAVSGIFLNHRYDINPNYRVYSENFTVNPSANDLKTEAGIKTILKELPYNLNYKKHYINKNGVVKVFVENGDVTIDSSGNGALQYLEQRPFIYSMNRLHKSSIGSTWKRVSDVMAFILIFVAVSGLFLLKGKRGFWRWGLWWMLAGVAVPLVFALIFI